MFAANSQLNVFSRLASTCDGLLHQRSNAFAVEHGKRIRIHDFRRLVEVNEFGGIIARETERGLRQIVRPE